VALDEVSAAILGGEAAENVWLTRLARFFAQGGLNRLLFC